MADDFLSGLLGPQNKGQDFASPLQVEIAKLLMEKSAPQQMNYDPSVPGGWSASLVNALGNINSALYRNQALRVNQGIIGNNARTAANLLVRPQDKQPAIKPSVVMKEANQPDPAKGWDAKLTVEPGGPIMRLGAQPNSGNLDWEGLPIINGIDEKAPYMSRPRDEADTKRIVFHGDVNDNADNLLKYGRQVDKKRGFDPNYHFYIAKDGTITQGVPLDRKANHVGEFNKDSIGIVLAGVIGGKEPTPEQRKSANMLAERLTKQYGLSQSNVFSHPELQPGHRDKSEATDVAANIRKFGFGEPTPEAQEEAQIVQAEMQRPPLSRGGLPAEQLNNRVGRFARGAIDPRFGPGQSEFAKNVIPPEQQIAGVTDIPKMAVGAKNLPEIKDPSRIAPEDRGATPMSVAVQKAQQENGVIPSTEIPKTQEPKYLPDEQREIESPLKPEAAIGRTRMAQMLPDKTGRPAISQGQQIRTDIPGYNGPVPSIPSLPSEKAIAERLHALAISGDQNAVNEFVQDIQERMQPKIIKVPNGELHITPKHYPEQNQVQFFPSAESKDVSIGGVNVPMDTRFNQRGDLEHTLRVPGVAGKGDLGSLEGLADFGQRIQAQGQATSDLKKTKTGLVTQAIEEGTKVNSALQTLNTLDTLSESMGNWGPRGPSGPLALKMRQFLDNLNIRTKGTDEAEVFNKFNTQLASEATQAFTNRGTNFDLQTFMRSNPDLMQSRDGTRMLLDIMKQEYKARQDIGRRASKMDARDVEKYQGMVEEYWNTHPITVQMKVNGKNIRVNTKKIETREDRDELPDGEYYITPDGQVAQKKPKK